MSPFAYGVYKWIGLGVGLVLGILTAVLGIVEEIAGLYVVFYTAATFALVVWVWNYAASRWMPVPAGGGASDAASAGGTITRAGVRAFIAKNRIVLLALLALIAVFAIIAATVEGFFTIINIISMLVLLALLVAVIVFNRFAAANKSGLIGVFVLFAFFIIASLTVDGFFSLINIKSMLVFAAFLGLACVGQTLVALLGGLDLSIPFVIGSANVALLYLLGLGLPSWLAVIVILILGALVGMLNGILSFRLQGQALILTLGVGFAISGLTQILTSIGTRYSGNVFGVVPEWLTNIAAMNGRTFGLDFPPVILIWLIVAVVMIVGMRNTVYGRNLYALGGNRTSARAPVDLRAALLDRRLYHQRLYRGADRCPPPRLERRRLHRRRRPVSVHDAGGGGDRRHVAPRRRRRLRLHHHRRPRPPGADLVPGRHRPLLRGPAIRLRPAHPADGRALRALAAHPHADLGRANQQFARQTLNVLECRGPHMGAIGG